MRLLVITQKLDIDDENLGSFHRWLEEFSKHMSNVVVIASFVGRVSLPENVAIYSLGKDRVPGSDVRKRLARVWKFWELFSHHYVRVDAVFFHMIPEFVVAAAPFIVAHRKPTALWYVHKSVTRALRIAESLVDFVFTASELSFRLPSKKVFYTGHAIDTDFFSPATHPNRHTDIRLLTVGRISPVKDYDTILHACALLKDSWREPWTLSIIGGPLMQRDQAYYESLKKLVREKGLERQVFFHGARPWREIPETYREHDVFLSMSTTGSIDKSVLEAMSVGLTVLTANEAFSTLLPPVNFLERRSPELLAARIKQLARENRPNMTLRNSVIEKHSLEKTIKSILHVYTLL